MVSVGLYVPLKAKPGKEAELEEFLRSGLALVEEEPDTVAWFAIKSAPDTFAIFDVFRNEGGRQSHLSGKVAEALIANASELLADELQIHELDVVAAKLPS